MKNKKLLISLGLALVFAVGLLLMSQGISRAGDCRIVRVNATATYQDVNLEPSILVIDKGTCVIWFNKAAKSRVRIIFEDGKKVCEDVIEASMDFELDDKNCFITKTYLPPFGTASLGFDKAGEYEYVVEITGTAVKAKGKIRVK